MHADKPGSPLAYPSEVRETINRLDQLDPWEGLVADFLKVLELWLTCLQPLLERQGQSTDKWVCVDVDPFFGAEAILSQTPDVVAALRCAQD